MYVSRICKFKMNVVVLEGFYIFIGFSIQRMIFWDWIVFGYKGF